MALIHVDFYSKTLAMDTGFYAVLPEEKQEIGQTSMPSDVDKYSVLWLLHGRSNDESMWQRKTSIERYVGGMPLMVIMPDASYSRYLNMAHGPRYYDYTVEELPSVCRRLFPKMSTKREKNYIAGLSMGGAGAMDIGLRNPKRFSRICMLSTGGVVPLYHTWKPCKPGSRAFRDNDDVYGLGNPDVLEGTRYDTLKLIRDCAKANDCLPKVFHAMGLEDKRYPVAMAIKDAFESLLGNPYNYEYHEGHGDHEWQFWDAWIREFLKTLPEAQA